ncbi:Putative phage serine protease XkdF [Aneurinibacillus thermoaerophilus]|uniref:Putative phage serine protease XkdF n=1 Tax=Aneurinibacillus thermoaerophilus TaxID=143495 RepID=A0A1G7WQ01_ANETH|nr:XkdF-like putative serine protease domain-containing protein [Aneurinibacillus thermoaerophilus]SDG73958.1 Putative phage serine protease XkdF [Aneurinibacillus thermoaerophilus]
MEKRIVYAPVLVPDKPDHDGDIVTAEQIQEFAHRFMASYRNIDLQHTMNNIGVPVESYIAKQPYKVETPEGEKVLPVGTWIMAVKVIHEDTWNRIKNGELTGFSIMAVKKTVLNEIVAKSREFSLSESDLVAVKSKTTLKDLGDDLEVIFVSIVDEPAVPDAKFFTIKSKKQSLIDKLKEKVNKALLDDSGTARKEVTGMTEEELKALLETIQALQQKVAALEEQINGEPEDSQEVNQEEVQDSAEKGEETETSSQEQADEVSSEEDLKAIIADLQKQIEELKGKGSNTVAKSRKLRGSDFQTTNEEKKEVYKSKYERDAFGNRINLGL